VLQFGEGNFLRAFVDYWFDLANEKAGWNGKCVLVQPIAQGLTQIINEQEGLYTLYLRGSEKGQKIDDKRVISSVSRCINPYEKEGYDALLKVAASDDLEFIVSNTTEAGIAYDPSCRFTDTPASSFPGKLTQALYCRYQAGKPGVVVLACELIDDNGKELLKCVNKYIDQWKLDDGFRNYINKECTFCGSLVDRIVPGRIRDQHEVAELEKKHGYEDQLIDVGEVFGVWVIEGDESLNDKLPFRKAGLEEKVFVTADVTPYKKRKVRILNGAHTGFVLGAYLAGENIVRDCMNDDTIREFMNKMLYEEVIPTLPLDKKDLMEFAAAVQDRFNNPFVDHELMSISLNSTSKWKARNMPSFLEYIKEKGSLPACLTMSLAAYIAFYSNDIQSLTDKGLICKRPAGNEYTVSDDRWALEFYYDHKDDDAETLVQAVLSNTKMWDQDLTAIDGLKDAVVNDLNKIRTEGAKAAYASCL
jgi:tagaturonate reductase